MKSNAAKLVTLAVALPFVVSAQEPSSPHEWSANVAITTDYLYRGISQTHEGPALQGGFDYTYKPLGAYVGVWASSIEFDTPGNSDDSSMEIDYYGGFSGEWASGVGWDIGGMYYYYPDQNEDRGAGDYNFGEIYGSLSYTFPGTLKPSIESGLAYSPDFFGEDGDGLYTYGKFGLTLPYDFGAHALIGYQDVDGGKTSGPAGFDYVHYSIGVSKEFGILGFDLSYNDGDDDCGGDVCEAFVFTVSSSW